MSILSSPHITLSLEDELLSYGFQKSYGIWVRSLKMGYIWVYTKDMMEVPCYRVFHNDPRKDVSNIFFKFDSIQELINELQINHGIRWT